MFDDDKFDSHFKNFDKKFDRSFNRAKRTFVVAFFIIALLTLAGWFVVVKVLQWGSDEYKDTKADLKELVGKEVILGKDTLMVINYSTWDNTVTLEDGRTVDGELIKKLQSEP